MFRKEIIINNPDDAKKFVDVANKYQDYKIDLKNGDYEIDGHSIMGILSLDMTQPIELIAGFEPNEEFLNDIKPFTAE